MQSYQESAVNFRHAFVLYSSVNKCCWTVSIVYKCMDFECVYELYVVYLSYVT